VKFLYFLVSRLGWPQGKASEAQSLGPTTKKRKYVELRLKGTQRDGGFESLPLTKTNKLTINIGFSKNNQQKNY